MLRLHQDVLGRNRMFRQSEPDFRVGFPELSCQPQAARVTDIPTPRGTSASYGFELTAVVRPVDTIPLGPGIGHLPPVRSSRPSCGSVAEPTLGAVVG
jgi:hypothetical protein